MNIHVSFLPTELPPGGLTVDQSVIVIDVLRASTSIVTALENGANSVTPVAETEAARTLAQSIGTSAVLGGEREGIRLPGFALGNSPLEYTPEVVGGRTVVITTTNGTYALSKAGGAGDVAVACFRNAEAAAEWGTKQVSKGQKLLILCAGTQRHFSLEDTSLAGLLVDIIKSKAEEVTLSDGALAAQWLWQASGCNSTKVMEESRHGRRLAEMGFGADLRYCAEVSQSSIVPVLVDGRLVVG